jgi:hypothetical protein
MRPGRVAQVEACVEHQNQDFSGNTGCEKVLLKASRVKTPEESKVFCRG